MSRAAKVLKARRRVYSPVNEGISWVSKEMGERHDTADCAATLPSHDLASQDVGKKTTIDSSTSQPEVPQSCFALTTNASLNFEQQAKSAGSAWLCYFTIYKADGAKADDEQSCDA